MSYSAMLSCGSATCSHRGARLSSSDDDSVRSTSSNDVLVLGERHLRRILTRYFVSYHQARTHLALDKDAPDPGLSSSPQLAGSWRFQKSAACTTATSAEPRSPQPVGKESQRRNECAHAADIAPPLRPRQSGYRRVDNLSS